MSNRQVYKGVITCYNMKATITIRMYNSTWIKIRGIIKAHKGETMAAYMQRVAEELRWANAQEFDNE